MSLENAKNSYSPLREEGDGRWEDATIFSETQRDYLRISAGKRSPSRILGSWHNDILACLCDKKHLYNCGRIPFRARVAGGQSLVFGEDGDGRWEMGDGILGNLKFEN